MSKLILFVVIIIDRKSGFDQNATITDDDAADENDDVKDEAGAAATAAEVDEELASEMVIIQPGKLL